MPSETTGDVYVDINAGDGGRGYMLFHAAHEYGHHIAQYAPAKFQKMVNYLAREVYGNETAKDLIDAQMAKAAADGRVLTETEAREEMFADALQEMFTQGNIEERLAKLKGEDRGLWHQFKDFVSKLLADIKAIYKKVQPESEEARLLKQNMEAFEKLADMFAEASVEGGQKFEVLQDRKTAESPVQRTENGVKYASRNSFVQDYDDYETHSGEKLRLTDPSLYPDTNREWSAFARSFANKTSGMKDGETRSFDIFTAEYRYVMFADGYMQGIILNKISLEDNEIEEDFYNDVYKESNFANGPVEGRGSGQGNSDTNNYLSHRRQTDQFLSELDAFIESHPQFYGDRSEDRGNHYRGAEEEDQNEVKFSSRNTTEDENPLHRTSKRVKSNKKGSYYNDTETNFMSWSNSASVEVGSIRSFKRFGKQRFYERTANGVVELSKKQFNEKLEETKYEADYKQTEAGVYGDLDKNGLYEKRGLRRMSSGGDSGSDAESSISASGQELLYSLGGVDSDSTEDRSESDSGNAGRRVTFSQRDPNATDARTLLSNALLETAQTDAERKVLFILKENRFILKGRAGFIDDVDCMTDSLSLFITQTQIQRRPQGRRKAG